MYCHQSGKTRRSTTDNRFHCRTDLRKCRTSKDNTHKCQENIFSSWFARFIACNCTRWITTSFFHGIIKKPGSKSDHYNICQHKAGHKTSIRDTQPDELRDSSIVGLFCCSLKSQNQFITRIERQNRANVGGNLIDNGTCLGVAGIISRGFGLIQLQNPSGIQSHHRHTCQNSQCDFPTGVKGNSKSSEHGAGKLNTVSKLFGNAFLEFGSIGRNDGSGSGDILQIKICHVLSDDGFKPFAFQIDGHVIGSCFQKATLQCFADERNNTQNHHGINNVQNWT
mmetsp:Transcript_83189/g.240350  ORF Transcript_83189/g.240350 Transcript_83189/m.240350 type:complete len:281 (+) Transcript_83189:278-1120(+)